MTPDTTPRRLRRLLLAAIAVLLCTTGLVAGFAEPASAAPKPARVKGVKLTKPRVDGTTASFKVKWKRASRATSYKVKWKAPGGKAHKDRTRLTSLTIKGLAQGTDYCVKVRAYNGKRKGKWSKNRCRTTAQLAQVQPVWVDRQQAQGATVALTFRWNEVPGATSYDFDYLGNENPIQGAKNTKRVTVRGTGSGVASLTLGGFDPGRIYCFQVRPSGPRGVGAFGTAGCKYTTPLGRTGGAVTADMMTWNVCANVCDGWDVRESLIRDRINELHPDAVAIQEAPNVEYDNLEPSPEYSRACKVGDGYGKDWRNQTLFVRDDKFTVTGTPGGLRFPNVTHGGCWAKVKDSTTQKEVVLASIHLVNPGWNNGSGSDAMRRDEMDLFWAAVSAYAGGLPILVAGDFNSTRNNKRDAPREVLNSALHDDAYDVAETWATLPYLNSWNGWRNPPPQSWRWGEHVDRIFAPPAARVTSWRMEQPIGGGIQLSDHSPVRVTVEIP
ncbi:fibronectin type III domain-containing protein [Nocardioides daeguensis]|uniref:Fibronectin type-III domain-containing protein n=1 Tax=Nocardioides daeguensis TaxID=908359 RepID=A0ABP6WJL7_9ACTN|nr:endonuclease/exonuclease/phosphatase family protein [Nocardioides daeguensis]MBV6727948.1 endonuclease/exonuclease/phosphatase family protein [Nocardioides daeguensis]MCR1774022.1 endonuclease/exonuclease/phosphatase family protein [Nocardioides daeguensis]